MQIQRVMKRSTQSVCNGLERLARDELDVKNTAYMTKHRPCIQSVIDDLEDGYYEVDLVGRYHIVNDAFVALLGYAPLELADKDNQALQTPEMARTLAEYFKEVYRTRKKLKGRHWEYVHKNGSVVCVEGSVNPLCASDGACVGFFGLVRDVKAHARTELALRASEEKYCTIVESMGDAYFEVDVRGCLTLINPAFSVMLGTPTAELIGRSYRAIQTEAAADQVFGIFHSVFLTRCTVPSFDWELLHRDGRRITGEGSVQPIFDERDQVAGFRGTLRDVTERRRTEKALRDSEQRFRALAQLSNDWFWELDANLRYRTLVGRGGMVTDDARDRFVGQLVWKTSLDVEAPRTWASVRTLLEAHEVFRDIVMFRTLASGRPYFVSVSGEPIFVDGVFVGYRGISRDITKEKLAESQILYLANHDVLTGLPNRLLFSQLLKSAIESAQRSGTGFAVLFIDLDCFKFVNDTLGHDAGDTLLKEIAARFYIALNKNQTLSRLGGDEFVTLVFDDDVPEGYEQLSARLLEDALQPIVLQGQECRVSASIGMAHFPEHGNNEQTLMKNADSAMYFAKAAGKNTYRVYSDAIRDRSVERFSLESRLRGALARSEFSLHFQPQIELASDAIVGVEALLRWDHPLLGSVSPLRFIGIAEETGLIVPIGRWVLQEACRQSMAWQSSGLPPVCIAVNLSARQFLDPQFLPDLASILECSGLPPQLLELEITEGMMAQDPKAATRLLHAIKSLGVRLAIDDFGTGYSSLSQIKAYPIDTLKIDRSFIHEIATCKQDQAIVRTIITMGKSLDLTVVAEGVETAEQERFLREQGCDRTQGYLFSKPIAAEAFSALIFAQRLLI